MADAPFIPLSELLGQERAVEVLHSAITSGRVHHAWIFTGPPGVGKSTAALGFAALLLDPTTAPNLAGLPEADPESHTQRLIRAGVHPDLHIITKELARFSEDAKVRERKLLTIPRDVIDTHLLEPIALAPTMTEHGRASKVFIIDEAELLDRSLSHAPVQNAILKTLEEPPPGSVIILVTSAEDALLPTIRSRCQRVTFSTLDERAMARWFERRAPDTDKNERAWLERFASGSPGRAALAAETGLHRWAQALEPMLASAERGVYHPEFGSTMASLVGEWAESWVKAHPNASKEAANQTGARHLLSMLAERWRAALRSDAGDQGAARALRSIDLLADTERHIGANVNMGFALENLAARLARAG